MPSPAGVRADWAAASQRRLWYLPGIMDTSNCLKARASGRDTRDAVKTCLLVIAILLGAAGACRAAVYNVHLHTDSNPDYTTVESFLETALPVWQTPQEQAIALWRWGVRNRRQTSASYEDGRPIYDPVLMFNDYANTYCAYIAGALEAQVEALGGDWRARYLELSDHTVMEMSWDQGLNWHLFDASMNIYCFTPDGVVASAAQIRESRASELSLLLGETGPVPGHDYLYGFAPECGSNPVNPARAGDLGYPWGYRVAADEPVPFARTLRNGADSYLTSVTYEDQYTHVRLGHRYRLNLRRGESYTRHWTHLGETTDYYRAHGHGGDPDDTHNAGDLRGNGLWLFEPDLATADYRLSSHDESGVVHRSEAGGSGPNLQPALAGVGGQVTFKVYGANVVTSAAVDLRGRRGAAGDVLRLRVSRDEGLNWTTVWTASTTGVIDARIPLPAALLGGARDWLCRVEMTGAGTASSCGLDGLLITTVTQLNRLSLPKLVRGANTVRLRLGAQEESALLWPPLHDAGLGPQYLDTAESSTNVAADDHAERIWSAILRPALGGTPAQVTWRLTTPTPITGLRYGGSFLARESGPLDRVELAHAFGGGAFTTDASFDASSSPTWDGRLYAEPASLPPGQHDVRLRYSFGSSHDASYTSTGVQDALMLVSHEPRDPERQPVEVTWCWLEHRREGDVERRYTQRVTGTDEMWRINVGGYRDPTMLWLRVNLPGANPDGDVPEGYHDGIDVGTGAGRDLVRHGFRWQDNVAFGAPYTVSRPAGGGNGDAGGSELTNGCLVPPTTYSTSYYVQEQTALWPGDAPVTVTLDLGANHPDGNRTVAALRITTHQPDGTYCHPDSIVISGAAEGEGYQLLGVIRHDQVWDPPGDFLGHESDQSPHFAALPAGGRLSYPYWLVLPQPRSLRFLQCTFQPLPGRGLGLSEIQALSAVTVTDWPDREVYMPGVSGVGTPTQPPVIAVAPATDRLSVAAAPNPFNARVAVAYTLSSAQRVEVSVFDLGGRLVRRLVPGARQDAGVHELAWDGADDEGRPAASGCYLVRVQGDVDSGGVAVVLVK